MSDPIDRELAVFSAARRLPAGERAPYLDEACAGDAALRRRVEELLRASEEAGGFLQDPASGAQRAADALTSQNPLQNTSVAGQKVGDRIGRYKLLQQIGEGGCGVVYMAEQEEPVRRRVALKVIKLGMDTKQVVARFEAERQALALMDHPNIAKVLEAGATDTGRPYFVMELVRGIKITHYCDENNLSTEERLELFIKLAQAVQHAHQKGIIHRDLKPSNILVADHDGVPVPKVIDFGIAKATTDQRLTDKTLFTAFEQFIGTPAYMSPEQARMSGLDIDTRTDIYSLGVLLYELLTGKTPFDAQDLLAAGLDEMRRTISEKEPARPSTRLSTMLEGELTTTAKHRHTDAPKLVHLLRGDLDWIVMKALEKDRARRYETANGLAMDIERHLKNEPVLARPPSNLYRFQKLVHRNKLAFAASAAIVTVLVLGVVMSSWQTVRATRSEREQSRLRAAAQRAQANEAELRQKAEADEKKAQTEAAKATAISDFLQQILGSANPEALKGSDYTVRQLLDDFSAGMANQLENQPEVEATVRATIGRAYFRLGVADKAQAHHERVLKLRRRIFGEQAEPVAESLVDNAWACFEQGQYEKGEPHVRESLDIYRKRGTTGQPILYALWALQKILVAQGRVPDAEAVAKEAMTIADNSPSVESPELASMIHGLAELKNGQSKYAEGGSLALKAAGMHRRLRGPEHPETAWALLSLGIALRGQQKLTEAEVPLREALQIFRKQYSSAHKSVEQTTSALKAVLEAKGDSTALEALARQRLADANKRIERNEGDADAWLERARGDVDLKLWEAAMADYAETIVRFKDADSTRRTAVGAGCNQLAVRAASAGALDVAQRAALRAIAVFKELIEEEPKRHSPAEYLGHSQWELSFALAAAGRRDEAESVMREALEVFQKAAHDFPAQPFLRQEAAYSHRLIGKLVEQDGQMAEAERHYRAAIAGYAALKSETPGAGFYHQEEAATCWTLASALERAGSHAAAEAEYRQALRLYEIEFASFPGRAKFPTPSPETRALYEKALVKLPAGKNDTQWQLTTIRVGLASLLRAQGKEAEAEKLERNPAER